MRPIRKNEPHPACTALGCETQRSHTTKLSKIDQKSPAAFCPCGSCRPGKCHSRNCRLGVNRPGEKFSFSPLCRKHLAAIQPLESTAFVAHHRCRSNRIVVVQNCCRLIADGRLTLPLAPKPSAPARNAWHRVTVRPPVLVRRAAYQGSADCNRKVASRLIRPTRHQKPASPTEPCDSPQSSCASQLACRSGTRH